MKCIPALAAFATWSVAIGCHADSLQDQMLAYLKQAKPNVQWDAKSGVTANFDGSQKSGGAMLGYAGNKVTLAIQTGSGAKGRRFQYLDFSVGPGTQAAVCAAPAKLEVYPLDCTTEDGTLPGCKATARMSGLSIVDGECDSIHLYWSHSSKSMQWWRR